MGVGAARLGNIFHIGVNVTSDLGGGGAERMELCISFQFVSTKPLFASLFWDTLHVASYHPSGSSKLGAPSPSSATWFWSAVRERGSLYGDFRIHNNMVYFHFLR